MVALIFLISILQPMNFFGSALVVKVAKDLVADNLVYINKTTTIFGVFSSELCSASCDKYATGSVNFRSFEPKNSLCKCFHASKEFRDSRAIAPDLDEGFYLVDVPLLQKKLYLAACDIKTTQEHSIQISVERAQGLSQDTCLKTAYHAESAAVFCPDEKLCGWDLQINRTAELKYLSMKSCQVFMNKRIDCALFEHELRQSDFNEWESGDELCGGLLTGCCVNEINHGYSCECKTGYAVEHNENEGIVSCVDFDECEDPKSCKNADLFKCINTIGSFWCELGTNLNLQMVYHANSTTTFADFLTEQTNEPLEKNQNFNRFGSKSYFMWQ